MCTVTYIPTSTGYIFTSNRDEQPTRKTIFPKRYQEDGVQLFYPKDDVAGGTWIGLSEKNRLVCLLNGGFVYHNPKLKFPKSRGVVVKMLLKTDDVVREMNRLDLDGVAPFTLIVVEGCSEPKIYQLTWCQGKKHVQELQSDKPNIWSSSTLYSDEMKCLRQTWFKDLLSYRLDTKKVLQFHQNKSLGEEGTCLKMKRKLVETISTTMVVNSNEVLEMSYYDYVKKEELTSCNIFSLTNV